MPTWDEFVVQRDKDLTEWTAFFDPLRTALRAFATGHCLKISRYRHRSPCWSLTARHPKAGVVQLEVERVTADSLRVHWSWWVDEWKVETRRIRWDSSPVTGADPLVVEAVLDDALRTIMTWHADDLTPVNSTYEWKKFDTADHFGAADNDLPVVRVE